MSVLGFVKAAEVLGLQSILISPKRAIGAFEAQVVLEEEHVDELEITTHPVEQGAAIADHAFKLPAQVTIKCGWSNSPSSSSLLKSLLSPITGTINGVAALLSGNAASQVRDIYNNLLALQQSRIPFDVFTGKRVYTNMLIKALRTTTKVETENSLIITAVLQQVIIVTTQTVTISAPPENQSDPQRTQPTQNMGSVALKPAPNFNSTPGG